MTFDLELAGTLSAEERNLSRRNLPRRQTVEREEDWLYFHLSLARGCRLRLQRMVEGSNLFLDEQRNRRQAVLAALKHYELLRRMEAPITPFLESLMRAEGL